MKKSLSAIARHINYQPKIVTLHGKKLSSTRLYRWLGSIKNNTKDIVIFYFTGHGGRTFDQIEPLPIIMMPMIKPKKTVLFERSTLISEKIKHKNPRLGICIFDCCNRVPPKKNLITKNALFTPVIPKNRSLPGLKTLFVKTRGFICIAAASPGQVMLTQVAGPQPGALLTTSLLHSLLLESKKTKTTWKKVCKATSAYLKDVFHGEQQPMYFLTFPKDVPATYSHSSS